LTDGSCRGAVRPDDQPSADWISSSVAAASGLAPHRWKIATASPVADLVEAIADESLAGVLAVTRGSVRPAVAIARRTAGARRIAAAQPALMTRIELLRTRSRGVAVTAIWGGTLKDNDVGPAIYRDFLPAALAKNVYRAAPAATVVGDGLEQIPNAIDRLRNGLSATKLVVRLSGRPRQGWSGCRTCRIVAGVCSPREWHTMTPGSNSCPRNPSCSFTGCTLQVGTHGDSAFGGRMRTSHPRSRHAVVHMNMHGVNARLSA
jgi:hypothetical protein